MFFSSKFLYMLYDSSMKIINNPTLKNKINELLGNNNININIADMLNMAFNYTDIINPNEFDSSIDEKDNIINQLYDFYQLDRNNEDNQAVVNEYIRNNIKCLEPKDYLDNPYVKTIKATGKYNGYVLKMINYEPYQLFPYDEIKVTKDFKEYSQIGYFKKPFSYLALTQGNNIWMSLNPNEIETMKPFIARGKGNVLVLGLGMGYVPFMLANKPEVKSITIVEKDQNIIDLFNKLLFPSFINKNKIKIIKDDAINYVNKNHKYDYIFADLWHNPEDGLDLFIKLKKADMRIDCWLDVSLFAMLRRCMMTLIEETINGNKEEDYKHARNVTDKVINKYYFNTKNLVINNEDDLIKLLSDKTLIELIIK